MVEVYAEFWNPRGRGVARMPHPKSLCPLVEYYSAEMPHLHAGLVTPLPRGSWLNEPPGPLLLCQFLDYSKF